MNQCECQDPFPTGVGPDAFCRKCQRPMRAEAGVSDLAAASDPSTTPDELGKLSFSEDPKVVAAVLSNPNTPMWAVNRASARATVAQASVPPPAAPTQTQSNARQQVGTGHDTRMLEAQLATVDYIRSGLSLLIMVVVSSAAVTLGNQAEFQKALACGDSYYCSQTGGVPYFVFGGMIAFIALVASIVYSFMGASHRRRAGG